MLVTTHFNEHKIFIFIFFFKIIITLFTNGIIHQFIYWVQGCLICLSYIYDCSLARSVQSKVNKFKSSSGFTCPGKIEALEEYYVLYPPPLPMPLKINVICHQQKIFIMILRASFITRI